MLYYLFEFYVEWGSVVVFNDNVVNCIWLYNELCG